MDRLEQLGFIPSLTLRDLLAYAAGFSLYFVVANIFLSLYYGLQTSPALIWPPVGLAVLMVMYGGYRMWLPILLAQYFATTLHNPDLKFIAFIAAVGFAIQAVCAGYLLARSGFTRDIYRLRNMMIIITVALFITFIEPIIATVAQILLIDLRTPLLNLGRAWGGGIFSAIVILPFALSWFPWRTLSYTRSEWYEIASALALLTATVYFLFWTSFPQYLGIAVIFLLPAVLIWFALRLQMRWMTLAILWTSVLGMAGSIIASPSAVPLNQQLLSNEIYIGFIAAIFLVFTAVVEERRIAMRELKDHVDKLEDFISIFAHEIRNPLAPILSSLELLKLRDDSAETQEIFKVIDDNVATTRRLLDDLLDVSRISRGKLRIEKERVDLCEVVRRAVRSAEEHARPRAQRIEFDCPAEEVPIFADPTRIQQVFANLLNNASRFTKADGTIFVSMQISSTAEVRIRDEGQGIEPDMLERIFEPFFQVDRGRSSTEGLGIGLALAKQIVAMHDGAIEAKSAGLGKGSEFIVQLPLA